MNFQQNSSVYRLLIGITLFPSNIFAMDVALLASKPEQKIACIAVQNKTSHKVAVYLQDNGFAEIICLTLVPGQSIQLKIKENLLKFYVRAYGQVRTWLTAEKLTQGYVQPESLVSKINYVLAKSADKRVSCVIKAGGQMFGEGLIRRVVRELLSYEYEIESGVLQEKLPYPDSVLAYLPQIQYAYDSGMPIDPRYALSLPENPNQLSIERAHQLYLDYWESCEILSTHNRKDLILLTNVAYEALKSNNCEIFEQLVRSLQRKNVRSNYQTLRDEFEEDSFPFDRDLMPTLMRASSSMPKDKSSAEISLRDSNVNLKALEMRLRQLQEETLSITTSLLNKDELEEDSVPFDRDLTATTLMRAPSSMPKNKSSAEIRRRVANEEMEASSMQLRQVQQEILSLLNNVDEGDGQRGAAEKQEGNISQVADWKAPITKGVNTNEGELCRDLKSK